jgi:hypothetical protein
MVYNISMETPTVRTAVFSDGTTMEVTIPDGSVFLEKVREHVNKETVDQVTNTDIGLFIVRASESALEKFESTSDEGD